MACILRRSSQTTWTPSSTSSSTSRAASAAAFALRLRGAPSAWAKSASRVPTSRALMTWRWSTRRSSPARRAVSTGSASQSCGCLRKRGRTKCWRGRRPAVWSPGRRGADLAGPGGSRCAPWTVRGRPRRGVRSSDDPPLPRSARLVNSARHRHSHAGWRVVTRPGRGWTQGRPCARRGPGNRKARRVRRRTREAVVPRGVSV
mmetsp:Transcript_2702/g.5968  ORF Transcript_2702/g.5968 Transcript_2702/m.5968 type:complete len:203 (-) Transcript_2702:83-691(-)